MLNLNTRQIISIIGAVFSVLMVASIQLTDLVGPTMAKTVVSIAGLGNLMLQAIMTSITGQGPTVQSVQAMPGIDKITINSQANKVLADLAVDALNNKIDISPGSSIAVNQTASKT